MNTILVVDDSTFARLNLTRALVAAGFQVLEAESGLKALEIAAKTPPDLVTLDLLMPGLSGLQTLVRLREFCPKTKCVVVTADVQKLTRDELMAAGADGFLNKPVSKKELLVLIKQLLDLPTDQLTSND
jgi:CheY-like chemotaxis protein